MGYFTDTEFDTAADMVDAVSEVVSRHVQGMRKCAATELGLDARCGIVYVDEECVAAHTGSRLDYYGGFEYIKEGEGRTTLGDYTFYTTESSRVRDALECLYEHDGDCESEEEIV